MRAYAYIRAHGGSGLREVSDDAVLAANYLKHRLAGTYDIPYDRPCKHEFVASAATIKKRPGVRTLDIAKRLIDYGYHPPTIYFPLIVEEGMLIEPTETESVETLDAFADALIAIAAETEATPELVTGAPHSAPVRRLDEAAAARQPNLRWRAMARRRDALPRLIRAHPGAVRTFVRLQVDSPTDAVDSTGSAPTRTALPPLLARWLVSSGRLVSGPRDRHGDIKLCGRAAVAGDIGYVTRSEENPCTNDSLASLPPSPSSRRRAAVPPPRRRLGRVDGARRLDRARRVRVRGREHGRRRPCRRSDPAHVQRRDRPSVAEPAGGVRRRRDRGPGRHRTVACSTLDKDLKVVPEMAAAMPEVTDNGATYTFKLKDGLKYSNGDPIVAADFVRSIRKLADPRNAYDYGYEMCYIAGAKNVLGEDFGCAGAPTPVQGPDRREANV